MNNKSLATELVEMFKYLELFYSSNRFTYAIIKREDGRKETIPILSDEFSNYLTHIFYKNMGTAINASALRDAINTINAIALNEGKQYDEFLRTGSKDKNIYINLANKKGQVVEITPHGWEVIDESPIPFISLNSLGELPIPVKNGKIDPIKEFLCGLSYEDQISVIAWLIGVLNPNGAYPILVIQGEHGTGKSTLTELIRNIIDPSNLSKASIPENERSFVISAQKRFILAYDNISEINTNISNMFCRMSTGEEFTTRKLYTDVSEVVIKAKRPIIINGIEDFIKREDLADRAVRVRMNPMSGKGRKSEEELWSEFRNMHPIILGGVCNAIQEALKNKSKIDPKNKLRMVDYSVWVNAAEPELPWETGTFSELYENMHRSSHIRVLSNDPLMKILIEYINSGNQFEGSASELLSILKNFADNEDIDDVDLPRNARSLSVKLKNVRSSLWNIGISVIIPKRTGKKRIIKIKSINDFPKNSEMSEEQITCVPSQHSHKEDKRKVIEKGDNYVFYDDGSGYMSEPEDDVLERWEGMLNNSEDDE